MGGCCEAGTHSPGPRLPPSQSCGSESTCLGVEGVLGVGSQHLPRGPETGDDLCLWGGF